MTTTLAPATLVADLAVSQPEVSMMIGIGLVKESEAVYFQYQGEDKKPVALTLPSGKALTRLPDVTLTGIDIAEEVGEFKSTKLNVYIQASGHHLMLTSGLKTIWSQCLLSGLMAVYAEYALSAPMTIDSWKGTSKMRPCFAAVRQNNQKLSDAHMYEELKEARSDRDDKRVEAILRDAVEVIRAALNIEYTSVSVEEDATASDSADSDSNEQDF